MEEGEQGIDNVAEPAVLQVDEWHLARCEVIARRECRRIPLIRRDDVRRTVRPIGIHQAVDEGAQL